MAEIPPAFAAEPLRLPATADEAQAVAAAHGWVIPAACLPGVVANLALLARHSAVFAEAQQQDRP